MKQELTLSAILLAIGGLLWIASSGTGFEPQQMALGAQTADEEVQSSQQIEAGFASDHQSASLTNQPSNQPFEIPRENSQGHYAVVPASYQQPITLDSSSPAIGVPAAANGSPVNVPSLSPPNSTAASSPFSLTAGYLHPTSNPLAVKLLAEAATEIANSNPFRLKLGLQGKVFQQEISASGNYYQAGQGSHKTKIELTFDRIPGTPKMLQLCDGRFVYTIHSTVGPASEKTATQPLQQTLEFVDLLRVKQATGDDVASRGVVSPTGWVATGGIASLLQHLASGFNFGPPQALDPNSNRVLIRGGWDEVALRGVVSDLDNNLKLGSPIQWNQVPPHIPHAIEMVLTRGANQIYFPSQISYLRFGMKDQQATIEPSVSMTFSTPEILSNFAEDFFVIDSSNLEPTDATDRYIARIESFQRSQRSRIQHVATEPAADSSTK